MPNIYNLEVEEYLCNAGCRYCDWESWGIGIKLLTKALEFKPDYHDALFWRAHAYQFRNHGAFKPKGGNCNEDYDKAIADYIALLEMNGDYNKLKVRNYLAYAYYQKGDYDKALREWKNLLEEPSFLSAELLLAGLLRKPGEELSQCEINLLIEDLSSKRMGKEGEKKLSQYEIDLLVEYLLNKQTAEWRNKNG